MDTKELLKKVRKIEIKTKNLSNQIFSGEYHSAFKGKGMAFSEVREYMPGDDIRTIDWNVTARYNHPYVKVFEDNAKNIRAIRKVVRATGEVSLQSHRIVNGKIASVSKMRPKNA